MSESKAWLRRAGRLDGRGGETILWSVAEGRRGRRWRSVRRDAAGALLSDVLLELDPDGRWTRLELASAGGLLTLHPEPDDRAVHGNVITDHGVVHVAVGWSPRHRLVVEDEPIAAAALGPAADAAPGPGVVVGSDLAVRPVETLPAPIPAIHGLPGPTWPLET